MSLENQIEATVGDTPEKAKARYNAAKAKSDALLRQGQNLARATTPAIQAVVTAAGRETDVAKEIESWETAIAKREKQVDRLVGGITTAASSTITSVLRAAEHNKKAIGVAGRALSKAEVEALARIDAATAKKIAEAEAFARKQLVDLGNFAYDNAKKIGKELSISFVGSPFGKDITAFVNSSIVQPVQKMFAGGDTFKKLVKEGEAFSAAWQEAGGWVLLAFRSMFTLGAALRGVQKHNEDDWLYNDWQHQLRRWKALVTATDGGLRLPWRERSFRFYTVQAPGIGPGAGGLWGGWPHLIAPGSKAFWDLLTPNTRWLFARVEERARGSFTIRPGNKYMEVWRAGVSAYRYAGVTGRYQQVEVNRSVSPGLAIGLGLLFAPAALLAGAGGGTDVDTLPIFDFAFQVNPTTGLPMLSRQWSAAIGQPVIDMGFDRNGIPEIPARLFNHVPLVYLAFWYANNGANFPRMLRALEEIMWENRNKFPNARPPGDPLLLTEDAWGLLTPVDSTQILLNEGLVNQLLLNPSVSGSQGLEVPVLRELLGLIGAPVVSTIEYHYMLTPDSYLQMLEDIDTHMTGVEHLHKQRLLEVRRRPLVQAAIAHAKAIRVGEVSALALFEQLTNKVRLKTATPEEAARLSLLMIALFGPGGPS